MDCYRRYANGERVGKPVKVNPEMVIAGSLTYINSILTRRGNETVCEMNGLFVRCMDNSAVCYALFDCGDTELIMRDD